MIDIVIEPVIIVKYIPYQHMLRIIIFDTRGVKSWCWVKLNLSNQYSTNILLPKLELKRDLRKTLITIWRDYPTKIQIVRNSAFLVRFLSNLRGWKIQKDCVGLNGPLGLVKDWWIEKELKSNWWDISKDYARRKWGKYQIIE